MNCERNKMLACCGLALALGVASIAAQAAPPKKAARRSRQVSKESPRLISKEVTTESSSVVGDTEFWLFGVSDIKRMTPLNARGARVIIDLRTLNTKAAIKSLDKFAKNDMGMAICLRWKNPDHTGDRPRGEENYDVPPTEQESAAALSALADILSSAPAKQIGKRLYVEIYNEIGGGPGRFGMDDVEGMFAFADAVVPVIRDANPDVRICGPALSGGQLTQYGMEPKTEGRLLKSEVIERWMEWTATHADVTDVHLNGIDVDAQWADNALSNMREILDDRGGQKVGIVSFEWSCSGYPDREDAVGIGNYIHDLWATLKKHNVEVAAYTYWPLFDRPEEIRSRTSWASVIGENKKPNQVVAGALSQIASAE